MGDTSLPLLLEPEALTARLDDPGFVVVDLSDEPAFLQSHIPGALHVEYRRLLRSDPPAMGLMAHPDELSALLSETGVHEDNWVVAYDREGNGRACRFLWTLTVIGHSRHSLLNGGLHAWAASSGDLAAGAASRRGLTDYRAELKNPDALADKDYILARLGANDFVVLDARSPAEYSGDDQRAARGGHIPGAVNLDWTQAMDRGRELRLKPEQELRALLEDRGVTPDKEIVTHCQTHHRSAHTFMVLRHLGYPRVRGYAGSWSEWGNLPDTPIER